MKTQKLLTPLALAMVALLSVGAHAAGGHSGGGHSGGGHNSPMPTAATAVIVDGQTSEYNTATNNTVVNDASVTDSLGGASGNIGVNVAAGDNNQQANAAAIAVADADFVFAQAGIGVNQRNQGNSVTNIGVPNDASLTNSANSTSGSLGINIAAGNSNQQKNDMAIASASKAPNAAASVAVYQDSSYNNVSNIDLAASSSYYKYQPRVPVANNAVMTNSLVGVSGNAHVSLAAGSGNQQNNSLAIAAGCTACQ